MQTNGILHDISLLLGFQCLLSLKEVRGSKVSFELILRLEIELAIGKDENYF
jgi:hypothetical protein